MATAKQIVVYVYDSATQADTALTAIQQVDRALEALTLDDIAVVRKAADGTISFTERHHYHAGPALYAAIAVRLGLDIGFPNDALRAVGKLLDPDTSALITLVTPEEWDIISTELDRLGGTLIQRPLPQELIDKLAPGATLVTAPQAEEHRPVPEPTVAAEASSAPSAQEHPPEVLSEEHGEVH
jgi:uncharacterized membrane protein